MTKPFNIHDWQAKQRQQLLNENDRFPGEDEAGMAPRHNDLEYEVSKYIGQTFASWMSPSNPEFSQEYAKPPYIDKLVKGIMDIVNSRDLEEHHGDDFPEGLLDKKVSSFLDDLKKKDKVDYESVEDIMKKHFNIDEMSVMGTDASFQGSGEGYMAPFKKKKK